MSSSAMPSFAEQQAALAASKSAKRVRFQRRRDSNCSAASSCNSASNKSCLSSSSSATTAKTTSRTRSISPSASTTMRGILSKTRGLFVADSRNNNDHNDSNNTLEQESTDPTEFSLDSSSNRSGSFGSLPSSPSPPASPKTAPVSAAKSSEPKAKTVGTDKEADVKASEEGEGKAQPKATAKKKAVVKTGKAESEAVKGGVTKGIKGKEAAKKKQQTQQPVTSSATVRSAPMPPETEPPTKQKASSRNKKAAPLMNDSSMSTLRVRDHRSSSRRKRHGSDRSRRLTSPGRSRPRSQQEWEALVRSSTKPTMNTTRGHRKSLSSELLTAAVLHQRVLDRKKLNARALRLRIQALNPDHPSLKVEQDDSSTAEKKAPVEEPKSALKTAQPTATKPTIAAAKKKPAAVTAKTSKIKNTSKNKKQATPANTKAGNSKKRQVTIVAPPTSEENIDSAAKTAKGHDPSFTSISSSTTDATATTTCTTDTEASSAELAEGSAPKTTMAHRTSGILPVLRPMSAAHRQSSYLPDLLPMTMSSSSLPAVEEQSDSVDNDDVPEETSRAPKVATSKSVQKAQDAPKTNITSTPLVATRSATSAKETAAKAPSAPSPAARVKKVAKTTAVAPLPPVPTAMMDDSSHCSTTQEKIEYRRRVRRESATMRNRPFGMSISATNHHASSSSAIMGGGSATGKSNRRRRSSMATATPTLGNRRSQPGLFRRSSSRSGRPSFPNDTRPRVPATIAAN